MNNYQKLRQGTTGQASNKVLTIGQEIERYQDLLRKNPAKEFSEFWEVNSCSLPLLTQLVNEFSILVASSVPSESSFSEAGYVNIQQPWNIAW